MKINEGEYCAPEIKEIVLSVEGMICDSKDGYPDATDVDDDSKNFVF